LSITDDDPRTVIKALDSKDGNLWKKFMDEEMVALDKKKTWDLFKMPTRRKHIDNKWVLKKNFSVECKVKKYKARLVEKRYFQVEGIDFGDID